MSENSTIEQTDVMKYVVISPVRDEARFIDKTLQSMVSQSVKPCEWIIVNDGSKDGTEQIVERYTELYPWMKLINRPDRGFRKRGGGVVDAFYDGYDTIACEDYGIIVKLDGDLSFEAAYFERLLERFAAMSELGIAGGECYVLDGGVWVSEGTHHVRGSTKVYRRECFEAIGGLKRSLGWDGVDVWKARMLGWKTVCFTDLKVLHLRPVGADTGKIKGKIETGRAAYFIGYHPLFMLARGLRRMADKPYVLGGLALLGGYFGDWLTRRERVDDPELINYVRQAQLRALTLRDIDSVKV